MSTSQKLIATCPECGHEKIYNGTALRPRITCSECKTRYYISTQKTQKESSSQIKEKKKIRSSQPKSPTNKETQFIDDPDELLMSVAVRELNKPNPDPRWANVLITTRKENIGFSKKEGNIQSKFKSMNIKDIAKISSGKPIDISQKPDLKESS